MEDIVVSYRGYSPSYFAKSYLENVLRELRDESPSSAVLRATISRAGDSFKVVVTISSSVGSFFAIATGYRMSDVSHKLVSRVRRQLDRWKSQRIITPKNLVRNFEPIAE